MSRRSSSSTLATLLARPTPSATAGGEDNTCTSTSTSLISGLSNGSGRRAALPLGGHDYWASIEEDVEEAIKPEIKKRLLNGTQLPLSTSANLVLPHEPNLLAEAAADIVAEDGGEDDFEHGTEDFGSFYRIKSCDFCGFCNKTFDDKAKYLTHGDCYFLRRQVEAINGGKPVHLTPDGKNWIFKCEFDGCPKSGTSRSYVSEHYAFHFEQKYVCKYCGKRAHSNSNIRKHISSLHVQDTLPD